MFAGLNGIASRFAGYYVASNGKRNPEYHLPKLETIGGRLPNFGATYINVPNFGGDMSKFGRFDRDTFQQFC
ncbi:MAG: hypothetical protein DI589_02255 [Shinella sp.]|nr:MAG: hypothetical protein DI589_02255 [Shinella sp.]